MRCHRREAQIDRPLLALLDLVHRRLHVVVDAAPGDAAQGRKRPQVGIEQHLMPLRRIRLKDEGATGAQFQMGREDLAPDAADDEMFLAPVELESFAQLELERNIRPRHGLPAGVPPPPNEFGHPAVIALKSLRLEFREQLQRVPAVTLRTPRIRLQHLEQPFSVRANLGVARPPPILRLHAVRLTQPALDGVPRQTTPPRYLRQRQTVSVVPASNPSQFLHGDHLLDVPAQILSGRG